MSDDDPPELGDVMYFPDHKRTDDKRWIVLFEDDYENWGFDLHGNLAFLVDIGQAGEMFRLSAQTLAELSHLDADSEQPIRDMIDALEDLLEEADD